MTQRGGKKRSNGAMRSSGNQSALMRRDAANGSSTVITSCSLSFALNSQAECTSVSGPRRGCGLVDTDRLITSSAAMSTLGRRPLSMHLIAVVLLIYNKFPAKSSHLRCIDIACLCTLIAKCANLSADGGAGVVPTTSAEQREKGCC